MSTSGATAAWIDFSFWLALQGRWSRTLSKRLRRRRLLHSPQPRHRQSGQHLPRPDRSAPPRRPPPAATGGDGPGSSKSGSSAGAGGGCGNSSGSSQAGGIVWNVCKFRKSIPCSADVIGDTLGLPGSPACNICRSRAHYHGECPMKWGNAGVALPGFALDGQRNLNDWRERADSPGRPRMGHLPERQVKHQQSPKSDSPSYFLGSGGRAGPTRVRGVHAACSQETMTSGRGAGALTSAVREPGPRVAAMAPPNFCARKSGPRPHSQQSSP